MNPNQRTPYQGQQSQFYGHRGSRSGGPPSSYSGSRANGLTSRKRTVPSGSPAGQMANGTVDVRSKQLVLKKKKLSDKVLPQSLQDLVPESQAYMDLLSFERKLDATITRKTLDIQEALKRPLKVKCKLRVFISNQYFPAKADADPKDDNSKASWELRVEGKLLEDPVHSNRYDGIKQKRKFSSFFKSLVIELDKDLYGPDNHLVEWHRTPTTQETDGFQVKRHGDKNVRCTMLFMLNHLPPQFKVDLRLGKLLGVHTLSRPKIMQALWQYIKSFKLQDNQEKEFINCDSFLEQIFGKSRMKFAEIPQLLQPLLHPPDPVIIQHVISVNPTDVKKQSCYDIDVELDDSLKTQMSSFLLSSANQQETWELDKRIYDTVATVKQHRIQREFYLGFSENPQEFVSDWVSSQTRDLKTMTDAAGNKEEERAADFYYSSWSQEAVTRYFYTKVQQRRLELEQVLKSSSI